MDKRVIIFFLLIFSVSVVFAHNKSKMLFCHDEGYFCVDSDFCDSIDVAEEPVCPSTSESCCMTRPSCARANGKVCSSRDKCDGYHLRASDTEDCCIGKCNELEKPKKESCEDKGYFCVPKTICSQGNVIDDTYFCTDTKETCCLNEEKVTCSQIGGVICKDEEICNGNVQETIDTKSCCLSSCSTPLPEPPECEIMKYNCYNNECPIGNIKIDFDCDKEKICCGVNSPVHNKPLIEKTLDFFSIVLNFIFSSNFITILLIALMAGIIYLLTKKSKMSTRLETLMQIIDEQKQEIDSQKKKPAKKAK